MQMYRIAIQSYLYVVAFTLSSLGLIGLSGIGVDDGLSSGAAWPPAVVALSLLCTGGVMLSVSYRSRRLTLGLLVLLVLVTLLPLVGPTSAPPSFGHGVVDTTNSLLLISLLAGGIATTLSSGRAIARSLAALIGLALIIVSASILLRLGPLQPGFAFGPLLGGVGYLPILVLGGATVLLSFAPVHQRKESQRVPTLVAASTAFLACVVFYIATSQAYQSMGRQSEHFLSDVQKSTERALRQQLALLGRMAERWSALGQLPSENYWKQEASSYLRDFPDLHLIGLLDADFRISELKSKREQDIQWLHQFIRGPSQRDWLEHVRQDGQAHFSQVLTGATRSEVGLLMVAPIKLEENRRYYIFASINVRDFMGPVLGTNAKDFALKIFEGDEVIYGSDSLSSALASYPVDTRDIEFHHDRRWRAVTYISNSSFNKAYVLPAVVLAFGIVSSFLLTLSQQLNNIAGFHARRLKDTNRKLVASLTEQHRAQLLNQRIMQFTMDVFCSFDNEGRFCEVSPSCFKLFGYRPEELVGRSCLELVLEDDRESTIKQADAVKAGNATYVFHNRFRHKDGRILYILWSAEWSEAEQQLFAVAHDVTGLVKGEQFAESQRSILGMIAMDRPKAEILEATCRMIETQVQDVFSSILLVGHDGRSLYTAAAPSLPADFNAALDGLAVEPDGDGRGLSVYEMRPVIASDLDCGPQWQRGREHALALGIRACWCLPLISHRGQVIGALVVYFKRPLSVSAELSDQLATASKLACVAVVHSRDRRMLEEREQHFRSLFTFNPDAVFSFDLTGIFQSINNAGADLLGQPDREVIGQHFSDWVLAEDLDRTQECFTSACKGIPQRYELRIRNRGESCLTLDVSNFPIIIGEEIVGVFGIAKDVTQRERMTADLKAALQRSERQAEQLGRLGRAAMETVRCHDRQTLIDYLVEQVRLTIGAHQAVISVTQGADWSQAITGFSVSDKYAAWRDYDAIPTGEGIYAWVCENNDAVILTQQELENHPRWRAFGEHADRHPPMRGWIAAPLVSQDGTNLGLLQLSDKDGGEFGPEDLSIAQQYAQMVVSIVENSRLMGEVLAAEQRLKAQLAFTSTITDCMAEGLLAVDRQGTLRFVNPAAQRWLAPAGAVTSDIIGQPLTAYLPLDTEHWVKDGELEIGGEIHLSGVVLMFEARPLIGTTEREGWVIALRDMSDQRRADQALRERDQFFRLSLEMFCMVSLDGHFIQVNPAFTETLRRRATDLIGTEYLELVDEEDRPLIDEAVKQLQGGAQIHNLVVRVWDGEQTMHWLQLSAALGSDRVIYCVARDITEQRVIQQQLIQRNLILGLAGQTARLGGWSIELPGREVVWSREMFSLLRFPQSFGPSLDATLDLYPNEYRTAVLRALDVCMAEGGSFDLDAQVHDAFGRMLDVRLTGCAVRDEHGEIVRISGALQDISDRKQAQRELQRLAERLSSILESITDAFITFDNQWCFTYVNSEAADLLKQDKTKLLGNKLWDLFPDFVENEIGLRYLEAKRGEHAAHFETYYGPLNCWFEIHAYPSEEGLAVYFRDISERKATERELEKTVAELERSNRELQEFAFVASHDLQEPLRKIQTFSERLQSRREHFDEQDHDYLQRMSLAASRMQALIVDLLDYSRVNSRGQPLRIVSLDSVMDEVMSVLEEKIAQTKALVKRSTLPSVYGDASQLRQVLQNLIGNSIKFQPAGQGAIVRVYAEKSPCGEVTLCIADNGIGFDEKYTSKIFNPFQRLHGKETYPGTGIGLAIVKKVIDRHGASIAVSSAPGMGSVFRITFPNNEAAVDAR